MSVATPVRWTHSRVGQGRWIIAFAVLGSMATVAAAIVTNGSITATVAPTVCAAIVALLWILPIRIPLLALTFLVLAADATDDGPWNSPLASLGRLLSHNLNKTIPLEALSVPLMAVVLLYLLLIHIHRRLIGSATDTDRLANTARPMLWALGLSFLTVVILCAVGIKRDGDAQMAKNQVQAFVLLILMAYLLAMSLRGTKDHRRLAGVIVAAAAIKSAMVLWIWQVALTSPYPFMTSHGDSMLFVCATTILLARVVAEPIRRNALTCLMASPLFLLAMVANNRRLAWVELAAACVTLAIISPASRLKHAVSRALLLSLPVVAIYVGAGWNSESALFAPVQMLRSVGDADVDRSTLYRDVENYNLLYTLRQNPLFGSGFGKPYVEAIVGDDISGFKEYRFMPHNSVLGLWGFGGVFGFTGLSAALVIGVFMAARGYRSARSAHERMAAFAALSTVIVYEIQCWGDIGFSDKRSIFLVGAALAVAGQLASATEHGRHRTVSTTRLV
jgi:hypothetical protein